MSKVVYGWYCGEELFYVGIGNISRAKSKLSRNKFCLSKRSKAEDQNNFQIKILYSGLTLTQACEIERQLIQQYGRRDLGTGCLTNMTDGGEGSTGALRSQETKNKISRSKSGDNHPLFGKNHSPETRERMSKSHGLFWKGKTGKDHNRTGKRHSIESKEKMSKAQQGKLKGKTGKECPNSKPVQTPLGVFFSKDEAAKAHNVSPMTITNRVKSTREKFQEYIEI